MAIQTILQNCILTRGNMTFDGSLATGASLTFNLYKVGTVSPVYSFTLNGFLPTGGTFIASTQSYNFLAGETVFAQLEAVGTVGSGTWSSALTFY
jgi:hypothetical protein